VVVHYLYCYLVCQSQKWCVLSWKVDRADRRLGFVVATSRGMDVQELLLLLQNDALLQWTFCQSMAGSMTLDAFLLSLFIVVGSWLEGRSSAQGHLYFLDCNMPGRLGIYHCNNLQCYRTPPLEFVVYCVSDGHPMEHLHIITFVLKGCGVRGIVHIWYRYTCTYIPLVLGPTCPSFSDEKSK
jgi:hypothetical protein